MASPRHWPRMLTKGLRRLGFRLRTRLAVLRTPGLSVGRGVWIGSRVRIDCRGGGRITIGDHSVIGRDSLLVASGGGELLIGRRVEVTQGCVLSAARRVSIGDDGLIGERVTIRDQDHGTDPAGGPYRTQQLVTAPIDIAPNVWLGANVVVLKGVSLGEGAVIAAGGVVTRDVPAGAVAGGVPAKVLREALPAPGVAGGLEQSGLPDR